MAELILGHKGTDYQIEYYMNKIYFQGEKCLKEGIGWLLNKLEKIIIR